MYLTLHELVLSCLHVTGCPYTHNLFAFVCGYIYLTTLLFNLKIYIN